MSANEMSHEWCEVSLKIDKATAVTMSRRGARGHSTKRTDGIFHRPCTRRTTQHSTSWRSATDAVLPGHREHTGGSRQDTHGTPVLTTVRRPWVAQPHEHARASARDTHAVRTPMVLNTETGGDQRAW